LYLRQLVLAVFDLDRAVDDACAVFDTKVLHTDPAVASYGVRNAVIPIGTQYLELMEPLTDAAPAARFLTRHGAGLYAVLLQCDDDRPYRHTAQRLGIRSILEHESGDFRCVQLHPVDAGLPVILEIDQQPGAPHGPYYPAGNDTPEPGACDRARVVGLELPAAAPREMAARWRELLTLPAQDSATVPLDNAVLRFGAVATVHVAGTDFAGPDTFALAGLRFRVSRGG
jgi:hypothetical protein